MTSEDRAAAFAARWVRCYTARVGAEAAEDRRAEIDSDLWEQRAHGRSVGAPPHAVALSIVRRVVGGVPADLVWSRQQRVVSRGRPPEREVTMSRFTKHWWWTVAAVAVAVSYVALIAGNLVDPEGPHAEGSVLAGLCAVMVLVGVGVRVRHRAVGDVLIAVSVAPAVAVIWLWPVAVTALVALVCAVVDLADARALRRPGPLGRLAGAALVVAVLGTGVAWLAMVSVGGWVTVLVAVTALVALVVLVLALGRYEPVDGAPRAA